MESTIASAGDDRVHRIARDVLEMPQVPEFRQPLVAVVPRRSGSPPTWPLLRGRNVDRPRTRAASATVG